MRRAVSEWPCRKLVTRVRYSRSAEFSGTCFYDRRLITVNIGRQLRFPYDMYTSLARARSNATLWWKPACKVILNDSYQLVLFVFLHEFYHWLVYRARRNMRQKESMCDRFAARELVDRFGVDVQDEQGRRIPRADWDFQDLDGFVAAARRPRRGKVIERPAARAPHPPKPVGQLLLFELD